MKPRPRNTFYKPACLLALVIAAPVIFLCARASRAQGSANAQAEAQYQKAERLRAAFEAQPEDSRSLLDYKKMVAAYRRVYLLSSSAGAVTPALMEVAQLYHEMGDEFDQAYYQNALATYKFLFSQYPGSKFRPDALFEIGKIEKEDAQNAAEATDAFKQFLRTYPHSPRVAEARVALKEIAAGQLAPPASAEKRSGAEPRASAPDESRAGAENSEQRAQPVRDSQSSSTTSAPTGVFERPQPDETQSGTAEVTAIRTWNADDYTRVVVDLSGDVQYQSARIKNPDRIYFDLYKAQLGNSLTEKELPLQNGFLREVRVAQNNVGVVRLVLDVTSIQGYSAFLLPDPYRLVIDVHGALVNASNAAPNTPANKQPPVDVGRLAGDAKPVVVTPSVSNSNKVQVAENDAMSSENGANAAAALSPNARRNRRTLRVPVTPAVAAKPMRDGERSLTRALGLKINRIVIDPGHGGHDTGTIGPGPHPLMEKNICLDIALRLGKLIHKKLPGAQVIYTRTTDVFVPLEERTAIANQAKADLFISIHANSSPDEYARGIETYYLSFTTSQEALATASRENALSNASIHQLQDFIRKIASNDKIEESRELADDIQGSLTGQLRLVSTAERNRGVKKAPFVVLIGANMPSVLVETSFLSNPRDENLLRRPAQRERVAYGIFRGVERYLSSLNSLAIDEHKTRLMSDQQSTAPGTTPERQ
ncbi:MAG TPA: N-acetylmuramoyl-L-alanine amidase [Candidatus Acidoferrales bacterium]|nr:N-acetylmuramoyl-L-alanine amidase [Candidatus Acidoferrales bacterium]